MTKKLPPKVLVLVSEYAFATSICDIYQRYWYNSVKSDKYDEIKKLIIEHRPHVIVIDDVISEKQIHQLVNDGRLILDSSIPCIIISCDKRKYHINDELIKVINKPFTPLEIIDCTRELLKKSKPALQNKILEYKGLVMDLETYKVTKNGKNIHLGPSEFKILQLLFNNPNSVFSRTEIMVHIWGKEHKAYDRTVDVFVSRLRNCLNAADDGIPLIKTIRSAGYCLNTEIYDKEKI